MSKKQTTQAVAEPWSAAQPYLRDSMAEIDRLAGKGKLDPFVAPSALTKDYIKGMGDLGRDNPFTNQTMANYGSFMGANTSSGPVTLSGDTFGMDRISDFVMSKTLPQVAGMFGQGGFANSTMAQQTAADAVTNALTPFAQQQFNLDRGRMDENAYYNSALDERNIERGLQRDLSGLQLAPNINAMQYADLAALGAAGGARDAINQDRAMTPANNATAAANLYMGMGGLGGSQTQTGPGASPLETAAGLGQFGVNAAIANSLLGGGGIGAGTWALGGGGASALFPGMVFCDRRLKRDVERTALTLKGLALYTFRYFFDAPNVRRIGPMADEAPARARAVLPSGFLAVDMGAL
jgi:hypothetical protein